MTDLRARFERLDERIGLALNPSRFVQARGACTIRGPEGSVSLERGDVLFASHPCVQQSPNLFAPVEAGTPEEERALEELAATTAVYGAQIVRMAEAIPGAGPVRGRRRQSENMGNRVELVRLRIKNRARERR